MDEDQISINILPDEILLLIFRKLPATDFIVFVPQVCKRWSKIVTTDTCTLKQISMHHINMVGCVNFFFLINELDEQQIFDNLPHHCKNVCFNMFIDIEQMYHPLYETAFFLCTQYSEVYKHIKTLLITSNLAIYLNHGFTYLNNLTTLMFHKVKILAKEEYTLIEFGKVYLNIQNVVYTECQFELALDKEFLYTGFKQLKRFRLDYYSVSHRLLEDLLKTHHKLKVIVLDQCHIDDRWIDVLMDKLKGQTIKSINMHSLYLTDKCVDKLLTSDLILDKSKINISRDVVQSPFSITIV